MPNKNVYKYDEMKRKEHMAVRKTAGWYLWTHQLVEVTGEGAAELLEKIFTNPISNIKIGRERYTTALDEKAQIIDDVVVFRLEEKKFWISTLFATKMIRHLTANKGTLDAAFVNITPKYHMFAVQGPRSLEIVNALVDERVDDLKFFSFRDNVINGEPVIINRAGFTGEKVGYEIYIAADKYEFLLEKLKEVGPKFEARQVTEFQVMAWTLPTEAGFYYMRDLMHTNPFEVGLTRGIDWDKEFIGKKALLKIQKKGAKREMVGFTLEEADVRINGKDLGSSGSVVTLNGEPIGVVSKFNYSYVQEKPVGYLLVDKGAVKVGDHVVINRHYDATITEKSFL